MGKIGVWILALGGGVLTLLYLLPWAHIALDLLGNCRDAPRAVQEVSLVQKPHRRSLSSPSKRSSTKARPISARITTAPSTASTSTRCACRDSPMILISTEDYACRSGSNQRGRFPRILGSHPRDPGSSPGNGRGALLHPCSPCVWHLVGLLDFIVDDGGHTMDQQQTSLKHLLPLVKPGGT
ncbi:unnamed protein product [Closterium sp. NIES-53]